MAKTILILSSSPRQGGNSELLCEEFARGARQAGHQVQTTFLRDKTIHYCTGCGSCFQGAKACPQKDDMADVLDAMLGADVIVMATPVYFYTMNAQMKTLIDRTCARYTELSNKEFYFIMTAADANKQSLERTLEGFRGFTSCLDGAAEKGAIYGAGAWQRGDIKRTAAMQEALEMGKAV